PGRGWTGGGRHRRGVADGQDGSWASSVASCVVCMHDARSSIDTDACLMLGLLVGGLSRGGRIQHAGDEPGRQPDEPVPAEGGLGKEGGGWSEVVQHLASPAVRWE